MLNKCINPRCSAKFMYLHEGVLYSFDYWGPHHINGERNDDFVKEESVHKYFWLCSQCSWEMTLHPDGDGGVVLVPTSHGSVFERSVRAGPSTVTFAHHREAA